MILALVLLLLLLHAGNAAASPPTVFTLAGKESAAFELPVACVPVAACSPRSGRVPAWPATGRALGYRQGVRPGAEGCLAQLPDGTIVT